MTSAQLAQLGITTAHAIGWQALETTCWSPKHVLHTRLLLLLILQVAQLAIVTWQIGGTIQLLGFCKNQLPKQAVHSILPSELLSVQVLQCATAIAQLVGTWQALEINCNSPLQLPQTKESVEFTEQVAQFGILDPQLVGTPHVLGSFNYQSPMHDVHSIKPSAFTSSHKAQ